MQWFYYLHITNSFWQGSKSIHWFSSLLLFIRCGCLEHLDRQMPCRSANCSQHLLDFQLLRFLSNTLSILNLLTQPKTINNKLADHVNSQYSSKLIYPFYDIDPDKANFFSLRQNKTKRSKRHIPFSHLWRVRFILTIINGILTQMNVNAYGFLSIKFSYNQYCGFDHSL